MAVYTVTVEGRAGGGQTWRTEIGLTGEEGNFPETVKNALRFSFEQLTGGKAVYGQPGLGCNGPYTITRLVVERKEH